jgi:hypothetical protein
MSAPSPLPDDRRREPDAGPDALGHPRGTLAIVMLYGVLFAAGWLAMYLFRFLAHGAPRP